MSSESLSDRIRHDMKEAMRAKDSARLGVIRMILAAIKRREVDERITLDDNQVTDVLIKMQKQHKDSISQFGEADRQDLVEKETAELAIVVTYLPAQLEQTEVDALIAESIKEAAATSMKDMGKVMAWLKPKMEGRTDMALVSAAIKKTLSA